MLLFLPLITPTATTMLLAGDDGGLVMPSNKAYSVLQLQKALRSDLILFNTPGQVSVGLEVRYGDCRNGQAMSKTENKRWMRSGECQWTTPGPYGQSMPAMMCDGRIVVGVSSNSVLDVDSMLTDFSGTQTRREQMRIGLTLTGLPFKQAESVGGGHYLGRSRDILK
ncbi:hypothetical protein ElyMa_003032300 [Elysia marginata]|uniref:Uncharacterized protein n=1 Tax=Elysia marginata TaxID=1093978 RepID=A0AAV4IJ67_9GAST|nr:hypothetical protein ElyMa_003032300 [Elysia marginata]